MTQDCVHDFRADLFGVRRCARCRIPEPPSVARARSIRERFKKFHTENPQVYRQIVEIARELKERYGFRKAAIGLIWERMRWIYAIRTRGEGGYKLNDHFRSEYARLVMEQESDLAGFFEIRRLRRVS